MRPMTFETGSEKSGSDEDYVPEASSTHSESDTEEGPPENEEKREVKMMHGRGRG